MNKKEIQDEIVKIEKKLEELRNKLKEPEITKDHIFAGSIFVTRRNLDDYFKNEDLEHLRYVVIIQCSYDINRYSIAGLCGTLANYSNDQNVTKEHMVEYLLKYEYVCANDIFEHRLVKK